jgi:hypothetical protein
LAVRPSRLYQGACLEIEVKTAFGAPELCTNSRRLQLTASKLKLPTNWEMSTGMSKEAAGRLRISVFQDVIFRLTFIACVSIFGMFRS